MREKLAQSADGLSESMREGRQSRRQLDEASLTIMQVKRLALAHSAMTYRYVTYRYVIAYVLCIVCAHCIDACVPAAQLCVPGLEVWCRISRSVVHFT